MTEKPAPKLTRKGPKATGVPGLAAHQRNVVGKRIEAFRKEKKMSQVQLQAQLATRGYYLAQPRIAEIEKGRRSVWDYELPLFAKVLGVEIKDLYPR